MAWGRCAAADFADAAPGLQLGAGERKLTALPKIQAETLARIARKIEARVQAWTRTLQGAIVTAVTFVIAAAVLRHLFLEPLGNQSPFITFFPAVALAALFGGLRSGAIATVLSAALVDYIWLPPFRAFAISSSPERLSLVTFVVSGLIVSWIAERTKQANLAASRAETNRREEVERLVQQRTAELFRVSDQLQSEAKERRSSEERFRQVIEFAPVAMIMVDSCGVIELVNNRAEQTFGYAQDELLGRTIDGLLPERFRKGHPRLREGYSLNPVQRAMGSGRDLYGLRKDGEQVPVEIGLSSVMTADGLKVITSVVDISERRRMDKALRESEQRIHLMFDNIDDHAILMLDPTGCVVSWNVGAERLKGYKREEIIGKHFSLFYPPEDVADGKLERLLIVAEREGRVEDEGLHRRSDGSLFLASMNMNAVRGPEGELRGFVMVTRDITERKRIESELIETNERFAVAAEAAGLGFWDYDIETRTTRWDDQMLRIYGLTRAVEQTQIRSLAYTYIHPDDHLKFEAEVREVINGARDLDIEYRIVQPGGRVRHLKAAASLKRDSTGRAARLVGVSFDITDSKQIENKLVEANERFAIASEAAGLRFWDFDVDTRSVGWNEEIFRLRGLARPEGVRDLLRFEHLHDDDRARIEEQLLAAALGLHSFDCEYRIVRPDGRIRHMKAAASLNQGPTGRGRRLIGVSFDITERKEAQLCLEEARDTAESANRAKTEFLAVMSHEIRTPLTSIGGFIDLLSHTDNLTSQQLRYIDFVQTANSALLTVINDILDFSKVEAGQMEIETRAFDLSKVVQDAVAIVRPLAQQKNLAMTVSLEPGAPEPLLGDAARLRQVLLNLLNNAIKFTATGSIDVSVRWRTTPDTPDKVRFDVTDTGIGIPAEQQDRLFKRFSQADSSIARQYGGTGLGLAICKRIVEQMGGEIGIVSSAGKGSTVWFTANLPVANSAQIEAEAGSPSFEVEAGAHSGLLDASPVAPLGERYRLLLVDDIDTNREIVQAYLERGGYHVVTAASARDAFNLLEIETIDLILMDVQMPVMDGVAATRYIRTLAPPVGKIPIIALTGNILPQQIRSFIDAGMEDHIGKPIEPSKLYEVVKRWLPAKPRAIDIVVAHFDRGSYEEFIELMGPADTFRMAGVLKERLGAAFQASPDESQREAHKLLTLSGRFGFRKFTQLCKELDGAPPDDADRLAELIDGVRLARSAVLQTLEQDILTQQER